MTPLPFIMVAPNGARRTQADHAHLPLSIAEITHTAHACHAAGADALHAHIRDRHGAHSLDAGRYRELLAALAEAVPQMAVQITTESAGVFAPAVQRQLLYTLQPAWASVAVREMLADGDVAATRRLYHWAAEEGVRLQHIAYSVHDLQQLQQHLADGVLPSGRCEVLCVLGQYAPPVAAAVPMLQAFLTAADALPQEREVMVCAFGVAETECLLAAAQAGCSCRVGFENNLHHPDGSLAQDNAARVAQLVAALSAA